MKNEDLINEGEAIKEGLERFLEQELAQRRPSSPEESVENDPGAGRQNANEPGLRQPVYESALRRDPEREAEIQRMPDAEKPVQGQPRREEPAQRQSGRREAAERGAAQRAPEGRAPEGRAPAGRTPAGRTQGTRKTNGKRQKGKEMSRRKKKKKSGLKGILLFLLFLLLLFAGMWYFAVGSVYNRMSFQKEEELAGEPMKQEGVTNILLIGNDSRNKDDDGRSDAMILISISNKTKKIYMTSLLRDMYVDIPGRDGNRLNAAYAYGGPSLLLETIEQNFDIEVNRYVLVNFQAFANLVDAVGGVDLELSNEEVKWVNAYLNEYNLLEGRDITTDYLDESLSGMIHLNGPQALAYCRNRYIGTDFERTNRQRKVLTAASGKLPAALATNSAQLIDGLFPQLTTNLTQTECYTLSMQAGKLLTYEIIQSSIPVEGSYQNARIRDMAVLEVDFGMNKDYIRKNIYGEE
ncbi:MAG: LCP family protein [Lachnospiraceae bacterium]|nr:LCP family protein [Lachnospiraceae bacterium]